MTPGKIVAILAFAFLATAATTAAERIVLCEEFTCTS
jgi:hypothetical protein